MKIPQLFGAVMDSAIQNALRMQAEAFQRKIDDLTGQISSAHITTPNVQVNEDVTISENIVCNEPLDAVKCLPELIGSQETYVSWCQAARELPCPTLSPLTNSHRPQSRPGHWHQ